MEPYFTIIVPFVAREFATQWHPTEATGPFSTLTRGAFKSEADAIRWAKDRLGGTPYSIRRIDQFADIEEPATSLNGATVTYSANGTAAWIHLPKALWREIGSTCHCAKCKEAEARDAKHVACWDTLAIATKPRDGRLTDHAWTVHMPEGGR